MVRYPFYSGIRQDLYRAIQRGLQAPLETAMSLTSWMGPLSFAVALLLVGCSMGTEEAKQGVSEFRAQVSQRAFNDVYDGADAIFRQAVTQEKFVVFMT